MEYCYEYNVYKLRVRRGEQIKHIMRSPFKTDKITTRPRRKKNNKNTLRIVKCNFIFNLSLENILNSTWTWTCYSATIQYTSARCS